MSPFSYNTRSLSGRLTFLFAAIAIGTSFLVYLVFMQTLDWSEDRVGERRIVLYKEAAVARFQSGETGQFKLDEITTAYNDLSQLPPEYQNAVQGKTYLVAEVGTHPEAQMVYLDQYTDPRTQQSQPFVILMEFGILELNQDDIMYGASVILGLLLTLLLIFKKLLNILSQRLIDPLNSIENQLSHHIRGADEPFSIASGSAEEFQHLVIELNRYRDENKRLLQREQAFARYASHELRTPLTVIQGSNNLLSLKVKDSFVQKQSGRIDEATQQMKTMVDALLSIVRYENSQSDIAQRELSEQEVREIAESNFSHYPDKNLSLVIHSSGSPLIYATQAVIRILVGNLIRNAIEATQDSDIEINLSKHALTITDKGSGLEHYKPDGHGLGLAIVEELCHKYQWQFQLRNNDKDVGCIAEVRFYAAEK